MNKTIITFFFIIIFGILNLNAQKFFFDKPIQINKYSLASPRNLATGDFDNDGKQDIAIISKKNNSVYWVKNENNNTTDFSDLKLITNQFHKAGFIKAGDIDNDGDIDLIVGENRGNGIAWFENSDGKGLFVQKNINNLTQGISYFIPADIDEDGDLDIIAAYWEGKRISYFENTDSQGNYSEEKPIALETGIIAQIAFKDIDGDSKKDIIALKTGENKIVWYKNNGTSNNFTEENLVSDNAMRGDALAVEDIDNDDDLDVVAAIQGKVVLYKNTDGKGNFSESSEIYDRNYSIETILIHDVDNDNDKDIILGNSENSKILLFKNTDGAGTFGEKIVLLNNFPGAYALSLTDFNGDNILDICAASVYESRLIWMSGLNDGSFDPPVIISESKLQEPDQMLTGDFNNDGYNDVVITNDRKNNLCWYKNNNKGESFEFNMINADDGAKGRIIEKADFDNDGDLDIISANTSYGLSILWLYENINSEGIFEAKSILLNNSPAISFIKPADLDNDGLIDIAFISQDKNLIAYAKNKGQGNFDKTFITISDNINNPTALEINDFDNDGDLDIICAALNEDLLQYFENNNGNFVLKNSNIPNPVESPFFITSGDINGDNYKDIIYSSLKNYSVYWMKNMDGQGVFSNSTKLIDNYWNYPDIILIEDIDHDGDNDIFLLEKSINQINWLENKDGNGTFSKLYTISNSIEGVSGIHIADIDNDSYKDFLILSQTQNDLFWNKTFISPVITKQPSDKSICENGNVKFKLEYDKADSLRWQVLKQYQYNFENIYDNDVYSGAQSSDLSIDAKTDLHKNKYRCVLYFKNNEFYSDTIELKVYTFIEADAGDDDSTCYSSANIYGSNPSPGVGSWVVIDGSANINPPDENFAVANNLSIGTNIFRWIVTNGVCLDFDDVTIIRKDSATIIKQPENLQLNSDQEAVFEVTVTGDINTYQWYFNDGSLNDSDKISGSQTNKLTIKNVSEENKGTYKCDVYGYCNFISSENAVLDIVSGTIDNISGAIDIYPNPAVDFLNIKSDIHIQKFTITDINNKLISTGEGNNNILDISNLVSGIYILKIETDINLLRYKFVKI